MTQEGDIVRDGTSYFVVEMLSGTSKSPKASQKNKSKSNLFGAPFFGVVPLQGHGQSHRAFTEAP